MTVIIIKSIYVPTSILKRKKYDLSVAEFAKNSKLVKLISDHVKLLLERNALISNLKKYYSKSELALLQGAGMLFIP